MTDLPERIAHQARELLAHLPEDEIGDDEPLAFRTDDVGNLMFTTGDRVYKLENGIGWKIRQVDEGDEVTTWKRRRLLKRVIVGPAAGTNRPGLN